LNIGERIKELRISKGLTQKQLGDKIGRSTISIRKYESGEVTPPYGVIAEIAKVLDAPANDLIFSIYQDLIDNFFDEPSKAKITFEVSREEKIIDKNGVEFTIAVPPEELIRRFYDIGHLLQHQEKAYYNGHPLNEEERQRALDMLNLLFPEYSKKEE
jgi:transcriptional regulator with XRE-family HTH domain